MSFSISDIRSRLNPVRPTLFEVTMSFPGLTNDVLDKDLRFYCRSSSVPASVVGQIEVPYFGRMMKIPGDRTFENWSVQVYNDEDLKIRNSFETWSSLLNSMQGNYASQAKPANLKGRATIKQFSKTGTERIVINSYLLEGLFPVNVSEMELAWEAQGQIQIFSVSFAYDDFTVIPSGARTQRGVTLGQEQ